MNKFNLIQLEADTKLEIDFKNMVHAPEYHPATPVNIEFEKKVYDFYGRNQMNWNIP